MRLFLLSNSVRLDFYRIHAKITKLHQRGNGARRGRDNILLVSSWSSR